MERIKLVLPDGRWLADNGLQVALVATLTYKFD